MEHPNPNHEPKLQPKIEDALSRTGEHHMLQFTKNGYRLFEYIETGETQTIEVEGNEDSYTIEMPINEHLLKKETSSLSELLDFQKSGVTYGDGSISSSIETDEFTAWKERLLSKEAIREAAILEVEQRQTGAESYPCLILVNKLTGARRKVTLDIALLLAIEEIKPEWTGYERLYPNDYQISMKQLSFDISKYLIRNMEEIGIDINNSARLVDGHISELDPTDLNVSIGMATWEKKDGIVKSFGSADAKITVSNIIASAQLKVSQEFMWLDSETPKKTGVTSAKEWHIQPVRTVEEAIEDLKTVAAKYGLYIGFGRAPIATGEVGPSFFFLDEEGGVVEQLSCDYSIREAIENAWHRAVAY